MEKGKEMATGGDLGNDEGRDDLLDGIGCKESEENYSVKDDN